VEIAIGTSVVIHVLLLLMLLWQWGAAAAGRWVESAKQVAQQKQETLLYPDQVIEIEPPPPIPPPQPKPEPQQYIRTTQNSAADEAPVKADFVSDRNTTAASELPADKEGDPTMPTQEGIDPKRMELANRDYKDGEIKEDGATPVPAMRMAESRPPSPAVPPPPTPSVLKPNESAPAAMLEPTQASAANSEPPSPPPPPPPAIAVAKAEPMTPLEAMMKEQDESDAARIQLDRLPLEVKKAELVKPADEPPTEPKVAMRDDPSSASPSTPPSPPTPPTPAAPPSPPTPPSPPAMAVPDPVSRTAGPQDAAAFSPFTRTSKARGTISNRGAAAVNAAETPVGRYMRTVTSAVEKKWHTLRRRNADAVTFGNLRLRFFVKPSGRVEPPQILSDRSEADARMIDFTLQAVLEAEIPPIPMDLLPLLDGRRLEVEYDVLIY
jgi:hypothetical protein